MQLPAEALAGARKIVAFWVRAFCDERATCSHNHSRPNGSAGRDMLKDMAQIDQLLRVAEDDFSPPVARKPTPSETAEHEEPQGPEAQAERLTRLWRLYWQSQARWFGVDREPRSEYLGEGNLDESPEVAERI